MKAAVSKAYRGALYRRTACGRNCREAVCRSLYSACRPTGCPHFRGNHLPCHGGQAAGRQVLFSRLLRTPRGCRAGAFARAGLRVSPRTAGCEPRWIATRTLPTAVGRRRLGTSACGYAIPLGWIRWAPAKSRRAGTYRRIHVVRKSRTTLRSGASLRSTRNPNLFRYAETLCVLPSSSPGDYAEASWALCGEDRNSQLNSARSSTLQVVGLGRSMLKKPFGRAPPAALDYR